MKRAWIAVRSALLWAASALHFFPISSLFVLLGIFLPPQRFDRLLRGFFRNVLRVAGAKIEVQFAPGFDPARTFLFFANHVNIFDPFVLYAAIPQFVRGVELESHFKIPGYGWMAKRFGNIPVPDKASSAAGLRRMVRQMKEALDGGTSLVVFPEGGRTRDGYVREFRGGVFRIAQQLGYPVVPISIVGSYEFHRTGSWLLHPGKITVHIHEPIETKHLRKEEELDAAVERVHAAAASRESRREDAEAFLRRVREVVAAPVHAALEARRGERPAQLPARAPQKTGPLP